MSSVLRFDEWQDSEGNPVLNGTALSVPSSALPAGSILQVVQAVKTDVFAFAVAGPTDIPGLSVTITPSSVASKVFILVQTNLSNEVDKGAFIRLTGGNAATYVGDAASSRSRAVAGTGPGSASDFNVGRAMLNNVISFVDAPNTASPVTYQVQVGKGAGTGNGYVNRAVADADAATTPRGASSIIVMEVAG
jgi:hypothetical protein